MNVRHILAVVLFLLAGVLPAATPVVAVVVNKNLQPLIQDRLDRYCADLTADGYTPVVRAWDLTLTGEKTPADLKAYLASVSGITGAMFIGDLPVCIFYHAADSWDNTFACDPFYMDLDNAWTDSNADGKYDTRAGTFAVRIWVSRIKASNQSLFNLPEYELVNRYLDKNHRFRTGALRLANQALMWSDTDWKWNGTTYMSGAYSSIQTVTEPTYTTNATDWMSRWTTEYETEFFMCHSAETFHDPGGSVNGTQIAAADPKRLFWNCWNCSSGDYQTGNYVAGTRLYTPTNGLLSIATTKTGSMCYYVSNYYTYLGGGKSHGDAFVSWWNLQPSPSASVLSWHYGLDLLGDGTLKIGSQHPIRTDAYVATPAITPVTGTYDQPQSVTISCSDGAATIRYTLDGSIPTAASTLYTGPIARSTSGTIKARAFKAGLSDSMVATAALTLKVKTPTISPAAGSYNYTVTVSAACATSGATLRYTTNGATPDTSSPIYSGSLTFTTTTTLKVRAFGAVDPSDIASSTFTIVQNLAPVVDAGPARTIQIAQSASLDGTVTDDGKPSNTVTYAWSKISGPGTVIFSAATAVDTGATFSAAGIYVLNLNASDGSLNTSDTVTVTVTENLAVDAVATPVSGTAPLAVSFTGTATGGSPWPQRAPGLVAEYFDWATTPSTLPDLTGRTADVVRVDLEVNYPSTSAAWTGLDSRFTDTFVARYTGSVQAATAGSYSFSIESDDGSRLWVDGALLIDNDGSHGMTKKSATVSLTAGYHAVRLEYFEGGGGAGLVLRWIPPAGAEAVIPSTALSNGGDQPPYTWAWDFDGNGTTDSTLQNPSFTYTANGVYNARVTVTDSLGATATDTVTITVGNPVLRSIALSVTPDLGYDLRLDDDPVSDQPTPAQWNNLSPAVPHRISVLVSPPSLPQ